MVLDVGGEKLYDADWMRERLDYGQTGVGGFCLDKLGNLLLFENWNLAFSWNLGTGAWISDERIICWKNLRFV